MSSKTARTLEDRFRARCPQRDPDYEKMFVFRPEDKQKIFADATAPQDYKSATAAAIVTDVKTAAAVPAHPQAPKDMDLDDPVLIQVQQLMGLGTSGIILKGAPGTGKSFYAKRIAKHLVADKRDDIFKVQFHPSYGYEDFVEGYRPDEHAASGYKIVDKTFVLACRRANQLQERDGLVVLIVDEINRGDPARVFGELRRM